jgi:hypothetical protein
VKVQFAFYLFFFVAFVVNSQAQELVPNGRFNYSNPCSPQSLSSPVSLDPWTYHYGSPDFFHPCFPTDWSVPTSYWGGVEAFIGEGYSGLTTIGYAGSVREIISVELLSALDEGVDYHCSFWVSMMDSAWYASKNIGACFSENIPPNNLQGLLALEPQVRYEGAEFLTDKEGWMRVEGSFTAIGGERYLTIGNFDTDEETDTLFVEGGGAFRPDQPNFFRLAYYYIDGVSLIPDSVYLSNEEQKDDNFEFDVYPNPTLNGSVTLNFDLKNGDVAELQVLDVSGRQVYAAKEISQSNVIQLDGLSDGIYHCRLVVNSSVVVTRKLVVLRN